MDNTLEQLYPYNFPDFYNNPAIRALMPIKRWTVSTTEKMPIDIHQYLDSNGRVVTGAMYHDDLCLTDMYEIMEKMPYAPNYAFYLQSRIDSIMILDIEPTCPEKLKREFLQMPYLYGEYSLSGKGLHLVLPVPEYLNDYPAAKKKQSIKYGKFFEIHLEHYVTFTRNMLPPATGTNTMEKLFRAMFEEQVQIEKRKLEQLHDVDLNDIPDHGKILEYMANQPWPRNLVPEHFRKDKDDTPDLSTYEFSVAGFAYRILETRILKVQAIRNNGHVYSDSDKAELIYAFMRETDRIAPREKHETSRNGEPWLKHLAIEAMQKTDLTKRKH